MHEIANWISSTIRGFRSLGWGRGEKRSGPPVVNSRSVRDFELKSPTHTTRNHASRCNSTATIRRRSYALCRRLFFEGNDTDLIQSKR
jgi:hypothetical protein